MVSVTELRPGLSHWSAPHPDWTPDQGGPDGWEREVSCYRYDAPDAVVLFDPLLPPGAAQETFSQSLDGRPLEILLTVYWHRRSAAELLERYPDATLWAHRATAVELAPLPTRGFDEDDELPGAVRPLAAAAWQETLFWLPAPRALVAGDLLLGTADGSLRLAPEPWWERGGDPRAALRRLLDLPVELVLPTHGEPVRAGARDALARALEAA